MIDSPTVQAFAAGFPVTLLHAGLTFGLLIAGAAAFPVNRWLIIRGWGHALVHKHHH